MGIQQKVKDIVDVRPFKTVRDLASSPGDVLAGYRFTDITADLMGKWLDAVLSVRPGNGAAHALAGFRGVGKTHFLAAFGVVLAESELRSKITDQHVSAVAGQMSRRRYPVVMIKRGSRSTLIEEIQDAVSAHGGVDAATSSLQDLLLQASKAGTADIPTVVLIDTASGRGSRVSRDDGPMLAQLGEAARAMGMFVGLALDDDIAGADGANRAISGVYSIDFLDQEHLYKIVDTHIFAKKEQSLPILHEIYKKYHDGLPKFRWSEQRFNALYPLHPAVLEIAPLIRFYIQDFATLGFAAEAGARILGRPADSLIGLDEVFDSAESRLRQLPELQDAFESFDRLDKEVVGRAAVRIRLQAKLVLKGLFMLSLDGQGSTADELAAAMLLVKVGDASESVDIAGLLDSFVAHLPESVRASSETPPQYCIAIGSGHDDAFSDQQITDAEMLEVLLRHGEERYSDLSVNAGALSHVSVEWRGSVRRGVIRWPGSTEALVSESDWEVIVAFDDGEPVAAGIDVKPRIHWRLAALSAEERKAIARLHGLQTDDAIREKLGEQLGSEIQIQAMALERIWKRILLEDARLLVDGAVVKFEESAASSHTLAELFTSVLEPAFASRYPNHPSFPRTLTVREAGPLISKFLGSSVPSDDGQRLARDFATALGLAVESEQGVVPAAADVVMSRPELVAVLDTVPADSAKVTTLDEIAQVLGRSPYGLTAETRHIFLAALVAHRELEFVTFTGNRINHRSLDLQILWDDIAGVARPLAEGYSPARLLEWARIVTGNPKLRSLESSDDRLTVIDDLSGWLAGWREARFLETFEHLDDADLNSTIWRTAENTRKTLGKVADTVAELVQNTLSLDRTLHQIADVFSDSVEEFERHKHDLSTLRQYIDSVQKRGFVQKYVALSEPTTDLQIEAARAKVLEMLLTRALARDTAGGEGLESAWTAFVDVYSDHYLTRHSESNQQVAGAIDGVLASDKWSVFESLSDLGRFDGKFLAAANEVLRRSRTRSCDADTAAILGQQPYCTCSFSLERYDSRWNNTRRLEIIIDQGLAQFAAKLNEQRSELKLTREYDAASLACLSADEISALRSACGGVFTKNEKPTIEELRSLLPEDIEDWEIDDLPVFAGRK